MASRRSSRLASKVLANAAAAPAPVPPVTPKSAIPRASRKRKSETLDAEVPADAENDTSRPDSKPATSSTRKKRAVQPVSIPAIVSTAPVDILPNEFNRQTFLEDAIKHLIAVDERMRPLTEKHHCHIFSPEGLAKTQDPWESLVSSIISQQVSGAAARSIKLRFIALFDNAGASVDSSSPPSSSENAFFPTPAQVLAKDITTLRTAGLSQRKAEYVQGLSAKFESGELSREFLLSAPYDELVARLTAVRGLGLWSVEMFAVFTLKQPDVCSLGDLGVQRGMAAFVGRDVAKLKTSGKGKWKYMNEAEMRELSERFRPYRSLFMWYIWRVENVDVEALEKAVPEKGAKTKARAGSKAKTASKVKIVSKAKLKQAET